VFGLVFSFWVEVDSRSFYRKWVSCPEFRFLRQAGSGDLDRHETKQSNPNLKRDSHSAAEKVRDPYLRQQGLVGVIQMLEQKTMQSSSVSCPISLRIFVVGFRGLHF
jgi:hypothetical protein